MNCNSIVQVFFHMTLNIKLYHWQTTSFARHKGSDDLHSTLLDLIDKFVEVYMGRYDRPDFDGKTFKVSVRELNDSNVIDVFDEYITFLKYELPKYTKESDTDLLNIRDEMLGELNKTKYLFTLN